MYVVRNTLLRQHDLGNPGRLEQGSQVIDIVFIKFRRHGSGWRIEKLHRERTYGIEETNSKLLMVTATMGGKSMDEEQFQEVRSLQTGLDFCF